MAYLITEALPTDQLPNHLLLLGDENQQLIDTYLPTCQVYLLTTKGQSIGICLLQRNERTAEIMNVAIEPTFQGQGLGKMLINYAINVARQEGLEQLVIKTGNSGIAQIALYQQLGFDLVGVNYNYFLEHYSQEIWENKIQCKHQLVFTLSLDVDN